MSEYELHSLIFHVIGTTSQIVSFWVVCSFGVVVARLVGESRLSRSMLRMMAFFYLVFTVALFARVGSNGARELHYRDALASLGYDPFPMSMGPVGVMLLAYLLLAILGTVSVVYLILWHRRNPGIAV